MTLSVFSDEYFMKEALKEAQKAYEEDEVPIGAVVVCNDRVIARAHNLTERLNDVTAHAEMQAITAAANYLGAKFLDGCTLYVTVEPCVMCAGASYWARIGRIVYGAFDEKRGYTNVKETLLHPKTKVITGVLENECGELMTGFFKRKREDLLS
ncbi:MAG: nucleoside deaminase [Bacteroidales bacterium]|nr:nucleoside deaminase [Bacteroidales bacterium]